MFSRISSRMAGTESDIVERHDEQQHDESVSSDEVVNEDLPRDNDNPPKRGRETQSHDGPPTKVGRFELSNSGELNDWSLDPNLAEYANKYMETFIQSQTLKEGILS